MTKINSKKMIKCLTELGSVKAINLQLIVLSNTFTETQKLPMDV
jgi:hypothetical protein